MKAIITVNGDMEYHPETSIEEYAINSWLKSENPVVKVVSLEEQKILKERGLG